MSLPVLTTDGAYFYGQKSLGRDLHSETHLKLFTNDWVPAVNDIMGNYTECDLSGYVEHVIDPARWDDGAVNGVYSAQYPQVVFTFAAYTGGTYIRGYYVTDYNDGRVLWAERHDSPFLVPVAGGVWPISLLWGDAQKAAVA